MTLKQLAIVKIDIATAFSFVAGTIYTVPALKRAVIKEILMASSAATNAPTVQAYVLPNGVTDLTADAANNVSVTARAVSEGKNVHGLGSDVTVPAVTSGTITILARNTILEAGDVIKLWSHKGVGAPTSCSCTVIVSGDEQ